MAHKQTTTSNKPNSSGKRRLEFQDGGRTLKNKTFFLDLPECKNINHLERELTSRGGKIEKFFHRDVKYLITNRSRDDSTSSPNTPGSTKSHKSPLESVSSVEPGSKPVYLTRAARMVAEAKQKSGSKKTVDMIAKAKSWGCKVISLDALLAELKRLKPISKEGKSRTPSGRVHTLTPPCLKVEDKSRGYRPLIYEPTVWPRPQFDAPIDSCPFDVLVKKSGRRSPSPDKNTRHHMMITRQRKSGYCECCSQRYDDLHIHLRSSRHQEYANDASNFINLDKLINIGTSYADFVRTLREKHQSKAKSSVQDVSCNHRGTPPTRSPSPPRQHCSSPQKAITLVKGAFTSPLTGRLRITPLKPEVGFVTPPIGLRKRHRIAEEDRTAKKHCFYDDGFVPETPEKMQTRLPRSKLAKLRSFIVRKGVSPTHPDETPSRLVVSLDLQQLPTPIFANGHTPKILLHQFDQKQSPNISKLCEKVFESDGSEGVFTGFTLSGEQQTLSQCVDTGVSSLSANSESQGSTKKSSVAVVSKKKTNSKKH